jgi:hypothetical protein
VRGERLGVGGRALGGAEVGELGGPGHAVDQDVTGLDVAVDDAGGVRRTQRQGDVAGDARGLGDLEPAALGQQALERATIDPLHDDERHAVGDVEVAYAYDVGVVQRRRRARVLQEAVGQVPVAAHLRAQHLQRDRRLELRVASGEHAGHGPFAELVLEQVAADPIPSLHGEAAPRHARVSRAPEARIDAQRLRNRAARPATRP